MNVSHSGKDCRTVSPVLSEQFFYAVILFFEQLFTKSGRKLSGYAVLAEFFCSSKRLNTMLPTNPAREPPAAASTSAVATFPGGLKANGARSPGIGDAVPGALFIMPSMAAAIPVGISAQP